MTDEKTIPPLSEEEIAEIEAFNESESYVQRADVRRLLQEVRRLREDLSRARSEEREACADICRSQAPHISDDYPEYRRGQRRTALDCETMIRARGEPVDPWRADVAALRRAADLLRHHPLADRSEPGRMLGAWVESLASRIETEYAPLTEEQRARNEEYERLMSEFRARGEKT